ncbi:cell wall-active antibiotics response protein LiaF [Aneurinibacillus thermoaerophilus]|uniref:Cell wall-active antibiotics response protein n=1 Tax=Aneurinibacillus thermoaerophilus TaxID=143495 RepID=A0ABX8YDU0_ANETH|nr:cell wall-active antibiotics response protein LiaF [Aneurinibacillus thermoaerophilus]MED0674053.1 cell wall-active antibiotics response protein LiaF [Aneurinibacillus thermoaerophilus]MED0737772.1 cell wall-active antibiotics response protein LiaF [Aneurinibacillus thermoaerophilus]QYY43550.1 cell wall-active antibiotics response protein [Aneurinibacillus thermoaerophilus]
MTRESLLFSYLLGAAIIFTGLGILFDMLGLKDFNLVGLFPFLFLYFGLKWWSRGKKIRGSVLLFIGITSFFAYWLNIDPGRIMGLMLSILFIYFGYRMIRGKSKKIEIPQSSRPGDGLARPISHEPPEQATVCGDEFGFTYSFHSPEHKHSLIGNLFLTGSRWQLQDMNIWHGIGDVKIDLSRAYIPDGETVIIINGWIGDIDIYVPYDLAVSLTASVNFGDIDVFGNKQGGINRSMTLSTSGYLNSDKRVRLVVSLLIGDIDVIQL